MKLAIFDVDGTLMDSQAMILASLASAFNSQGIPIPPRPQLLAIVGLSLERAMTVLRPDDSEDIHNALAQSYRQAFWSFRSDGVHPELPYDGAFDALRRLRQRGDVRLGIATGKSQRGVRHIIDQFGLHGYFDTIQTTDDAPSKPHPAMIVQAMAACGAEPDETVMIGDAVFDMQMARSAGVRAIGVSWGFQPTDVLRQTGAHEIVVTYDDLDEVLDALWQKAAA